MTGKALPGFFLLWGDSETFRNDRKTNRSREIPKHFGMTEKQTVTLNLFQGLPGFSLSREIPKHFGMTGKRLLGFFLLSGDSETFRNDGKTPPRFLSVSYPKIA